MKAEFITKLLKIKFHVTLKNENLTSYTVQSQAIRIISTLEY